MCFLMMTYYRLEKNAHRPPRLAQQPAEDSPADVSPPQDPWLGICRDARKLRKQHKTCFLLLMSSRHGQEFPEQVAREIYRQGARPGSAETGKPVGGPLSSIANYCFDLTDFASHPGGTGNQAR